MHRNAKNVGTRGGTTARRINLRSAVKKKAAKRAGGKTGRCGGVILLFQERRDGGRWTAQIDDPHSDAHMRERGRVQQQERLFSGGETPKLEGTLPSRASRQRQRCD